MSLFSWKSSWARAICVSVVLFVLAKQLQRGPNLPDYKKTLDVHEQVSPAYRSSRKHADKRMILRGSIQACAAIAAGVIAYVIVAPTWSSPAEFQRPVGFIKLRASCPGVEAVPSVVISDKGRQINITVNVYRRQSACRNPRLMLDLYGAAMIRHPYVDADSGDTSIHGPHIAEFYVRSTHPDKIISLLTITYRLPEARPDSSFSVAGQYGTPQHPVRSSAWKSWRVFTPEVWVQCTASSKWGAQAIGFLACPRDGLEDPHAAVGIDLSSNEEVQQASQPSDYPLGGTQYVHYRDMRTLAAVPLGDEINTWSDPNSIHGQFVEVTSVDKESEQALRYLLAGTLLGLSGGFVGGWIFRWPQTTVSYKSGQL